MSAKPFVIAAALLSYAFQACASPAPNFQQGAKLVGTGASGAGGQGSDVAISSDGNTVVVGAPNDNASAGAVWVYTRSGSLWNQQGGKLVGTGAAGVGQQGISVALSADGNSAVVGARFDNASAGAVWMFTRNAGVWTQDGAKLVGTGGFQSNQGYSVASAADGNTVIVGGPNDNSGTGAAWIFTRTYSPVSGNIWSQTGTKLVGTGAIGSAQQAHSVAISADGNTALVGGTADNGSAGAVWVYTRSANVWSQQGAKLAGTGATGTAQQGSSVALSADGNTALVGGSKDNNWTGAVWVYTRSGGVWTQQGAKLVGTGTVGGIYGNAQQGISVSLSGDGNSAVVGGTLDNSGVGAVWEFTRSAGVWSQRGNKLVGTGATGNSAQGSSVALSSDGSTAVVGGDSDNSAAGAAWVFVEASPKISSIKDIPNDQGGKVSLRWSASPVDIQPGNPVDAYWIWRQAPNSLALAALAQGASRTTEGATRGAHTGRVFRASTQGGQTYYWEYVGSQPADGYAAYSYSAPTSADSVPGSNPYTIFMVEAKQLSTGARWPSDSDSAYSVDNIPPAKPSPFLGNYSGAVTTLHWKANVEPDLGHYNLYRGTSANFVPGPTNLIVSLPDTSYADATLGGHFYRLSAVDVHGNESGFNLLTPQQVGGVSPGGAAGLWLGRAAPNPAQGSSVVRYSLAHSGPAELSVFSMQGGLVRRLVQGAQSSGEAQASWDGRNDRGATVPGGIYFVRLLTTGAAPLTQRLVWMR